jgi:hypothetical protein
MPILRIKTGSRAHLKAPTAIFLIANQHHPACHAAVALPTQAQPMLFAVIFTDKEALASVRRGAELGQKRT